MIYTHVLNRGVRGVASPLDALPTGLPPGPLQCGEAIATYVLAVRPSLGGPRHEPGAALA